MEKGENGFVFNILYITTHCDYNVQIDTWVDRNQKGSREMTMREIGTGAVGLCVKFFCFKISLIF